MARRYKRSTPPIRLHRHVEKMVMHSAIVAGRLEAWRLSADPRVEAALKDAHDAWAASQALEGQVLSLVDTEFVPPLRAASWVPEPGQHVCIMDRYRGRYAEMFEKVLGSDPGMLDDLVVEKVLPTGEVMVQRGRRTPFVARKSHLRERS